jgi:hypothetical protein
LNKISLLIPSSQISSGRLDRKSSLKSWNQQIKNAKSVEAHHQHLPPKGAVSFAKPTPLGVVAPFLPAVGKDWSLWGIQSSAERTSASSGEINRESKNCIRRNQCEAGGRIGEGRRKHRRAEGVDAVISVGFGRTCG